MPLWLFVVPQRTVIVLRKRKENAYYTEKSFLKHYSFVKENIIAYFEVINFSNPGNFKTKLSVIQKAVV